MGELQRELADLDGVLDELIHDDDRVPKNCSFDAEFIQHDHGNDSQYNKILQQCRENGKGTVQQRQMLLKQSPNLQSLHDQLVDGQVVSADEFWAKWRYHQQVSKQQKQQQASLNDNQADIQLADWGE